MFAYDPDSGRIAPAQWCPSPNRDARPAGTVIDSIVVHNISLPPGEFGGPWIADLFCNRLDPDVHPYFAEIADMRVSAHCLIRRDGGLTQFVPITQRAWHAGRSELCGRQACNDFSIGIELEGADDQAFTDAQYATLLPLIDTLRGAYPAITLGRIVGHSDIAPGRKTDPGPHFDWARVRTAVAA